MSGCILFFHINSVRMDFDQERQESRVIMSNSSRVVVVCWVLLELLVVPYLLYRVYINLSAVSRFIMEIEIVVFSPVFKSMFTRIFSNILRFHLLENDFKLSINVDQDLVSGSYFNYSS